VALADDLAGGFYWAQPQRIILLDARMDEANLVVSLARALNLAHRQLPPGAEN